MSKPLDAIFFDIDDTLFSTTVFADKARRAAIDAMIRAGLKADRGVALRELDEVLAEFSSNYGNHFDKVIERLNKRSTSGKQTRLESFFVSKGSRPVAAESKFDPFAKKASSSGTAKGGKRPAAAGGGSKSKKKK